MGPKIVFLLFCTILCISANFRVLISNITIVFSNFSLKIPKRTFLVSNLRIFIFAQNFLKLSIQIYTNKAFLVPKLKLFILQEWPSHKSESTDSNYNNFFKDLSLKLSRKEHFFVPNLGGTLHFHQFKGADFKYGNNFSNLKTKITQIRYFSFQV